MLAATTSCRPRWVSLSPLCARGSRGLATLVLSLEFLRGRARLLARNALLFLFLNLSSEGSLRPFVGACRSSRKSAPKRDCSLSDVIARLKNGRAHVRRRVSSSDARKGNESERVPVAITRSRELGTGRSDGDESDAETSWYNSRRQIIETSGEPH